MNYRTTLHREDKLLLSNSRKKTEDGFDCERRTDATKSTSSKRQSAEEKLLLNIPDTTLPDTFIEEKIATDTDQNTSCYVTTDIEHAVHTTTNEWISFDDSNAQYTTSIDVAAPKQRIPTTLTDNSNPGTLSGSGNWVKFEAPKDANSGIDSSSKTDISTPKAKESGDQKQETEGNLQHKENAFNNSELERISSLSKSPKSVNGVLCMSIEATSLHETAGIGNQGKDPQTAINRNVKRTLTLETDETLLNTPLPEYPIKRTHTTWSMFLRYPDTKRRIRGREWRPIVIKLNGSILQVYDEHDTSAPFREVSLQCFYDLTKPQLQQYHGIKLHTVKILYVKYKETHQLISKKNVQYIARTTPILKIASPSHTDVDEFIKVVRHAIRSLPIFRDRGISHSTEAVYINVHDTCSVLIDASGSVLMLGILVRIYLRAFISGDAECELVLNDIHMKSQEEARLRGELMPQRVHKWIKLEECDFHNTVNSSLYNQNRCIMLHPIDSCTFEVMQFRVRPAKPLPLLAKCELITDSHGRVELRAEVKLCSDPKLAKYERKNVCLYFPIPEAWAPLFMKEKRFRGERSITSTNSQKAIKKRNRKNRPVTTIEVSTGSARYEPEYKSIVWRINQLPILNTTAPADSTHDFTCHIQTVNSSILPDDYEPQCVMEYDIPYTVASDTKVVNFKVLDKKISTREVKYHTYYTYEIQMNITSLNNGGIHYDS